MKQWPRLVALLALLGGPEVPAQDAPAKNSCIDCHAGLPGPLSDAVGQWRDSSHARAAVSCEGCHRGDPKSEDDPKPPGSGFVGVPRLRETPYMCGRCHAEIMEKHLGSPHGALGLPHCVTCHGAHDIMTPDPERIINESACTRCHEFDVAQTAQRSLVAVRGLISDLDRLGQGMLHIPAVEEHLKIAQENLQLDREGVLATFHSFRIGDIERMGMNVERLRKTLVRLEERETKRQENIARERPLILALVGFVVFATFFGFVVYRHAGEVEPAAEE